MAGWKILNKIEIEEKNEEKIQKSEYECRSATVLKVKKATKSTSTASLHIKWLLFALFIFLYLIVTLDISKRNTDESLIS